MSLPSNKMAEAAKAFAIVLNLFASIILFGGIGYALDRWQGTGYRYTLIGLGVGLVIGFVSFIRAALKLTVHESAQDHRRGGSPKG